MSDNIPFIPLQILEKILINLDIKTLIRCASVCRDWNSLITGPDFIFRQVILLRSLEKKERQWVQGRVGTNVVESFSLHLDNDQFDLLRIVEPPTINGCKSPRMVGISNGLICLADIYYRNIVLWNPTIQKCVLLPRLTMTSGVSLGFGFIRKSNDFKVVKLVSHPDGRVHSAWVFSIDRKYEFILTFDLANEVFGETSLPRDDICIPFSIVAAGDSIAVSQMQYVSRVETMCHECGLPERYEPCSLSFGIDALATSEGTLLFEEIMVAKKHLLDQYGQLFPALSDTFPEIFPPKMYTWKQFLWACELWSSGKAMDTDEELSILLELSEDDSFFDKKEKLLQSNGFSSKERVCLWSPSKPGWTSDAVKVLVQIARIIHLNEVELYFADDARSFLDTDLSPSILSLLRNKARGQQNMNLIPERLSMALFGHTKAVNAIQKLFT
ncbi:hypothetical protein K1719_014430 [Acacia pycnantha]|nr:hypothetical protein K1719_014430 [Acacia pycnantha]